MKRIRLVEPTHRGLSCVLPEKADLCYAGRVVGCSQGSSADAIRYPRGMEQSG